MFKENILYNTQETVDDEKDNDKMLSILDEIIEEKGKNRFALFRKKELETEKKVDKISKHEECLQRLLSIYKIKDLEVKKMGLNLYQIPIKKATGFDELDLEYAYKGGLARNILEQEMGFKNVIPARDIDLARIIKEEDAEKDNEIAMKYSPEDLENGYGVEKLEKDYFDSRDFTINEVLVYKDRIILTKDCLLDTARGIIRFSDYEKKELYNDYGDRGDFESIDENSRQTYLEKYKDEKQKSKKKKFFVNDKLMAKALRFSAIQSTRRHSEIVDEEVYGYLDINNFHIALHLDRALSQGYDNAELYIRKMIDYGQLDCNYNTSPEKVLMNFIYMIQEEGSFVFRSEALDVLREEKGLMNNEDKFIKMARQSMQTRHIDDIDEYL